MIMYYVHATWGMKLHSTVNDGASKDFYFFFDEFNYSGNGVKNSHFITVCECRAKVKTPGLRPP